MPTPASTARQCLTEEAVRALDDAVAVARRRSHAQTTSLHAVSALMALPSSPLRDACARARSSGCSSRLQFRALELSVGVSLDRLPSSKTLDEPPISNSLMAAIKRSQANQRRHPDTFHLYQQFQNSSSSSTISCVKVELKHFILSILDDPIVSRVFGEAGFRSCDIKLAILNPPTLSRFSSSRYAPPLFLCNLPEPDSNRRAFNFPFAGISSSENGDENSRRIGEVLVKKNAKNPLLLGICARDALISFTDCVQRRSKPDVLPKEIDGISLICIEKQITEFVANGGSEETMGSTFKELGDMAEHCTGPGVVVSYGELMLLVNGGSVEAMNYVVRELSRLIESQRGKVWLIGATGNYDTYSMFLARFPSIDKDWDLHLLPITSSSGSSTGGLCSKSSLMGSFVPFGGFFPTPSEVKNVISSSPKKSTNCCEQCNNKYEQEVAALLKGGPGFSVSDQHASNLSPWLQTGGDSNRVNALEAKDDNTILTARLKGLQKKWNDKCQHLHGPHQSFQPIVSKNSTQLQVVKYGNGSSNKAASNLLCSSMPMDSQKLSYIKQTPPFLGGFLSPNPDHSLVSSNTCVTTDLGLGNLYTGTERESMKTQMRDFGENFFNHTTQSSGTSPELLDSKDFKYLYRVLAEKVERQNEAISRISQTVSRCRTGQRKGGVWLGFIGPDIMGKKRIAEALAEAIFGCKESLVSVDLNFGDGIENLKNFIFRSQDLCSQDMKFRGKMVGDWLADELRKKPRSVVFIENIDKADFLLQNSLSQAIRTGRFPDSHGREISVNNVIFVIASSAVKVNSGETPEFSEDRILRAQALEMQILVKCSDGVFTRTKGSNVSVMSTVSTKKRKLVDIENSSEQQHKVSKSCLDLNLPIEDMEEDGGDAVSGSENFEVWLDDLLDQVDEKVVFEPFDFDGLAKKLLKEISLSFQKAVGNEVLLEIEPDVMVQMLAVSWFSERKRAVEEWVHQVLFRGFLEARQRYRLTAQSVLKLASCGGDKADGTFLPARVRLE